MTARLFLLTATVLILALAQTASSADAVDAGALLDRAYAEFTSGKTLQSKSTAHQALSLGRETNDNEIIGRALTALCRTALRENDRSALDDLTQELRLLAEKAGEKKWSVYALHMNAEYARMNGRLDEADSLYSESLELSASIGLTGMVAAENFNKSFVAVAKGDTASAKRLIQNFFKISAEMNDGDPDPYGLIALANLLVAEQQFGSAAIVTYAARRIFSEEGVIPDPADATPLDAAERIILEKLTKEQLDSAHAASRDVAVADLIESYL